MFFCEFGRQQDTKYLLMELPLSLIYVAALAVAAILVGLLFWAPMKLYDIHRELKRQREEMRTQTRLLAAIANAMNPVDADPDMGQEAINPAAE
jgi:hypothetical protein